MANKKFSEFELKTTTSNVSHVVGYDGTENVRITPANFLDTTGGPYLPLAGGTMTGNTIHNDNVKSIYGSPGNDLEIYHDGSNSIIKDAGLGNLYVYSDQFIINNFPDTQNMARFVSGGAATLYYNGVEKFATTSTGISVTGNGNFTGALTGTTATFSGHLQAQNRLTLTDAAAGANRYILTDETNTGTGTLYVQAGQGSSSYGGALGLYANSHASKPGDVVAGISQGSNGSFRVNTSALDAGTDLLTINNTVAIFSPGSSEKMRLNSAGNLGIGTSTPGAILDVSAASGDGLLVSNSTSAAYNAGLIVNFNDVSTMQLTCLGTSILQAGNTGNTVLASRTNKDIIITPNGTGNVGIGTSTPDNIMHVRKGDTTYGSQVGADTMLMLETTNVSNALQFTSTTVGNQYIMFGDDDSNAGWIQYAHSDNSLNFRVNASEKMRLDSSGNLGIGTTSPTALLTLDGDNSTAAPQRILKLSGGTAVNGNGQYIQFSSSGNDALGSLIAGTRVGAGGSSDLRFSTTNSSGLVAERMRVTAAGAIQFNNYGSGTVTGTLAKTLGVTSAGDVIEFDVASGLTGVTNSSSDSPNSKTALGVNAGGSSETGVFNTSIGNSAGSGLTSGGANTIVGYQAGQGISNTNTSVAIGYLSKFANNSEDTVAIGALAMRYGVTASGVAIGYEAMHGASFPTNNYSNSVAVGLRALYNSSGSSGMNNIGIGYFAGSNNTTGSNNTYLGASVLGVTTGSNNTILGYLATPSSNTVSNEITLGNSSVTVIRAAVTSITALSDERDKKDIVPLSYGLDFINSLEPKEFVWDNRVEKRIETTSTKGEDFKSITTETEVEFYSANKGKKDFGFIAQEVKLLDDDTLRLVYDSNPEKLEMSYGKLVPILVKAIQELKTQLDNIK